MKRTTYMAFLLMIAPYASFARASEDILDSFDMKTAKIYYRCESQKMAFTEGSQMHEVSPGQYTLKVNATSDGDRDTYRLANKKPLEPKVRRAF